MFQRSSHPLTAAFHAVFKLAAVLVYLLAGMFTSSFIITFVVVVILMAADFWTTKNVTGRIMVGLRWWNDLADDGSSTWRFESIDDPSLVSRLDSILFWNTMYLSCAFWAVFAFLALVTLNLENFMICAVCLTLTWSNLYGYFRCSKDAQTRLQQGVQRALARGAVAAFTSGWFSGQSSAAPPSAAPPTAPHAAPSHASSAPAAFAGGSLV